MVTVVVVYQDVRYYEDNNRINVSGHVELTTNYA